MKLKIGSRKSKLALIQTNLVINQIKEHFPDIECEIIPITTTGDIITDIALYDIGGKALFLKEIEQQLLDNTIDLAVHSLKDVPGILPKGLLIAAVLEREDPRDVFVSLKYKSIEELPKGTKVGATSVRRKVFLHKMKHDVEVVIFRGNVDSRVNKLKAGDVDAAIIAAAGLKRLDIFNQEYCHILDPNQMLPAVGQGVIAIEIVEDNFKMREICNKINHQSTWHLICAERAFLEYLNADCKTPLAAYANYESTGIGIDFMMADFGGENIIFHKSYGEISEAKNMGIRAAQIMLDKMSKM